MNPDELAAKRAEMESEMREIERAQGEYRGRRLKELKAEIEAKLAEEGFSLADLGLGKGSQKSSAKPRGKGEAKYRHPENADITWTGRGRQPAWIKDHEANGGSREDFAI
nr:H-NS histone family protein [Jannaschia sp. Os4]